MATPEQVEAFVRRTRPPWNSYRNAYDWYGICAGLTYRTILECGGHVPDGPYQSAWAAYLDTRIESRDPRKAPPGAVHYWDYTGIASNGQRAKWGHVALDIFGGGTNVLSATGHAHEFWARSAGLISVAAQTARGMTYMGWSRTYGRRIRLTITTGHTASSGGNPTPAPEPEPPEEEDDMYKPTVHIRTEGDFEATLAHPEIGSDLAQHKGPKSPGGQRVDGKVTVYRGFMVTADRAIATAWARTHAKGVGNETSRTNRADYIAIQVEASRIAMELGS